MQDLERRVPTGAGWWTRLHDGSLRRVWAHRTVDVYVCLREIATPAQAAARSRLENGSAATTSPDVERDQAQVAGIRCDILRTPDLFEAFAFLGADSAARSALLEANPALSFADFTH